MTPVMPSAQDRAGPAPAASDRSARLLVATDDAMVRAQLRASLAGDAGLRIVEDAHDGVEAVMLTRTTPLDLAVVDLAIHRMGGAELIDRLLAARTRLRAVAIAPADGDERALVAALRAGASAYVVRSRIDRDVADACRSALADEPFLSAGALVTLIDTVLERVVPAPPAHVRLSPRELQVVELIADSQSSGQIAKLLGISAKTVERHRENVMAKLGVHDRVELTRYAIRHGIVAR
jgi:DNA-binding NarL/FixJ family response regulator